MACCRKDFPPTRPLLPQGKKTPIPAEAGLWPATWGLGRGGPWGLCPHAACRLRMPSSSARAQAALATPWRRGSQACSGHSTLAELPVTMHLQHTLPGEPLFVLFDFDPDHSQPPFQTAQCSTSTALRPAAFACAGAGNTHRSRRAKTTAPGVLREATPEQEEECLKEAQSASVSSHQDKQKDL